MNMAVNPPKAPEYVEVVKAELGRVDLQSLSRASRPLPTPNNPIVISVVRNERDRLGDFLRHYRSLGVERFIFIDNGSEDGTVEYLGLQRDVDLYQRISPFDWRIKQGWICKAIAMYGSDRWYLYVDADEHVVFDGFQSRTLQDVVNFAISQKLTRVRGFLLDMYWDGALIGSDYTPDTPLLDAYPYFDREGYINAKYKEIHSRKGGPRRRMFGSIDAKFNPELSKYPLFKLGPNELMANPHHIWPYEGNFASPCYLGLLHFKFLPSALQRIKRAVEEQNYWDGSLEYQIYLKALEKDRDLSFYDPDISARFNGSADLVECDLIAPIQWVKSTPLADRLGAAYRRRWAQRLAEVGQQANRDGFIG